MSTMGDEKWPRKGRKKARRLGRAFLRDFYRCEAIRIPCIHCMGSHRLCLLSQLLQLFR